LEGPPHELGLAVFANLARVLHDGRNRWRACQAAGVAIRTRPFAGGDPLAFVLSSNLHRRHLNESRRAMVASKRGAGSHSAFRPPAPGKLRK
jgi:hypothetical protein